MNRYATTLLALSSIAAIGLAVQPSGDHAPPPRVVTPGEAPGAPPSDAIILFDGTSLDGWATTEGKPAGWKLDGQKGGAMTVVAKSGSIVTKQAFGDIQLHLEFME